MTKKCATKTCYNVIPSGNGRVCSKCKTRKWRKLNPFSNAFKDLKSSAKKRGITFELSLQEFTTWCIKTRYLELKGQGPTDYSVDRQKTWIGYRIDNLQLLRNDEHGRKTRKEPRRDPNDRSWTVVDPDCGF